ncbi:MAG: hypothetical protein QMC80_07945, partial [Thermoplasmatales archaeon]|nr:hypothetical protein [Thermoplasmatales archaeon]
KKFRTGIKTSSKTQEKNIVLKAKELKKKPFLILPECRGECRKCPFDKIKKQIKKIQCLNEEKISYFTKHGNHLIRAYAVSLTIAGSEKAPYLAVAHLPHGTFAYAVRGKTKKEKLLGVQYYDDPVLRLLSIADIAKKKKLHVYSTKNCFVCTGKESKPPEKFIEDIMQILGTNLKCKDNIYSCQHDSVLSLKISFHNTTILICKSCASDNNTFCTFARHMLSPKIKKEFNINVVFHPECMMKCETCKIDVHTPNDVLQKYINDNVTDKEFIVDSADKMKEEIRNLNQKIFIADNKCYGSDDSMFINLFNPTDEERTGLKTILEKLKAPLIVEKATPNKILSLYWDKFGKDILFALTNDKSISEEMQGKNEQPSQILKMAVIKCKQKGIFTSLPSYASLPPVAEFADKIAKTYKTKGSDEALKEIEKLKTEDTKIKSVAYAFLLVFGRTKGREWQYSQIDKEFAQFLMKGTKNLIEAKAEEYHNALQSLLKDTGSTEIIRKD